MSTRFPLHRAHLLHVLPLQLHVFSRVHRHPHTRPVDQVRVQWVIDCFYFMRLPVVLRFANSWNSPLTYFLPPVRNQHSNFPNIFSSHHFYFYQLQITFLRFQILAHTKHWGDTSFSPQNIFYRLTFKHLPNYNDYIFMSSYSFFYIGSRMLSFYRLPPIFSVYSLSILSMPVGWPWMLGLFLLKSSLHVRYVNQNASYLTQNTLSCLMWAG